MKLNTDECHLLILDFKREAMWAKIRKQIRCEKFDVKLLGITTGLKIYVFINMFQNCVLKLIIDLCLV